MVIKFNILNIPKQNTKIKKLNQILAKLANRQLIFGKFVGRIASTWNKYLNLDNEYVEDHRNQPFTQNPSNIFTSDGSNIFTDSESVESEMSEPAPRKDNGINYDNYSKLFNSSDKCLADIKNNSSMSMLEDYNKFRRQLKNQRSLHK